MLEGYGINKDIYVVSNGVAITDFEEDEKSGEDFRRKYNYKKDDKIVVGIGLYIERKGQIINLFGLGIVL